MLSLQALATGSQSTRLVWADAQGPTVYKVLRSITVTPGPQIATVQPGTGIYNDHADPGGLTPATTYYYWLADQNDTLLTAATAVTTNPLPVKTGLVRVVQDAIQAWAVAASGLADDKVIWAQQLETKPLKPFVMLTAWGPRSNSQTQWREQANEALGDIESYNIQVEVFADPPTSDTASIDAYQVAADLKHSLDDPSVTSAFNVAGIGVAEIQGVVDLSAVLDTKFEQRAMMEFGINVGSSFPISVPYTIDTVAPPVGNVTP